MTMKKIILLSLLLISTTVLARKKPAPTPVPAPVNPVSLKYSVEVIFDFVLSQKKQTLNPDIEFPKIYFKSKTPLKQFQDAIEKQWNQRPNEITNAYAFDNNEIYLMDDSDYYIKTERCMDDSLAHELVHYVQAKYQKFDMNDESLEWDAVDIQTAFRDQFCPQKPH